MTTEHISFDHNLYGRLDAHLTTKGFADIYYIPPEYITIQDNQDHENIFKNKVKLLQFDSNKQSLAMFPFKRIIDNELIPKYSFIRCITLEGILEVPDLGNDIETNFIENYLFELPDCFVKIYFFGLGLKKSYRFLIRAVEELSSCKNVIISKHASKLN